MTEKPKHTPLAEGLEVTISSYVILKDPSKPSPLGAGSMVLSLVFRKTMPDIADPAVQAALGVKTMTGLTQIDAGNEGLWRPMTDDEVEAYKRDENEADVEDDVDEEYDGDVD